MRMPASCWASNIPTTGAMAPTRSSRRKDILTQRGSTPRVYRNMLVFIAAESRQLDHLKRRRAHLPALGNRPATRSAEPHPERQCARQGETGRSQRDDEDAPERGVVLSALSGPGERPGGLGVGVRQDPGAGRAAGRASKKLVAEEGLLVELGPSRLDRDLQKYIWNDKPRLSLKDLREYLNRYIYLPRLKGQDVLVKAVQAAISGMLPGPFAYAERWDEKTDTYLGLAIERAGKCRWSSTATASSSNRMWPSAPSGAGATWPLGTHLEA